MDELLLLIGDLPKQGSFMLIIRNVSFTIAMLIVVLLPVQAPASQSIYVSIDQYGRKVYSDTKPLNREFTVEPANSINTIVWQTVKPANYIKPKVKSKNRSYSATQTRKLEKCKKLERAISKYERLLSTRIDAEKFDETKQQLSQSRWSYQKDC